MAMRSDPIVMHPSDPSWSDSFELQRVRVEEALAPWLAHPVEHIGSTAVPGLQAKDIIDMVAIVIDIDAATHARSSMTAIGWVHAPEPYDNIERRLSFCFPSIERRSHHLHVVEEQSDAWRGWLAFRDHLRTHQEDARTYGSLKAQLADAHGHDPNARDDYRAGKAQFIREVTAKALAERGSR